MAILDVHVTNNYWVEKKKNKTIIRTTNKKIHIMINNYANEVEINVALLSANKKKLHKIAQLNPLNPIVENCNVRSVSCECDGR